MATYEFVTLWRFEAPLSEVWEELSHPERWPSWWPAVKSVVQLESGDEQGVGALRRYTWRGVLPYNLSFDMRTTVVVPKSCLEGVATGELNGTGRWQLSTAHGSTVVHYDWVVEVAKRWVKVLSPIARPFFRWNHDVVMRWGAEGLSALLAEGPRDGNGRWRSGPPNTHRAPGRQRTHE